MDSRDSRTEDLWNDSGLALIIPIILGGWLPPTAFPAKVCMPFIREAVRILVVIPGWDRQYGRIVQEFGYDPARDAAAAALLDSVLDGPPAIPALREAISGRAVFCVGAGPSLERSLQALRDHPEMPRIAADSAALPLLRQGIIPDVVVTDLDGDADTLSDLDDRGAILVVHAHGDNMDRLHLAGKFSRCVGTAQTEPVGNISNFGGFTDGDRTAFLASHFGAESIVLCGMDLGGPVSGWSTADPDTKLQKLEAAARLLEWLATFTGSRLYTMSYPLRGFGRVAPDGMRTIAGSRKS